MGPVKALPGAARGRPGGQASEVHRAGRALPHPLEPRAMGTHTSRGESPSPQSPGKTGGPAFTPGLAGWRQLQGVRMRRVSGAAGGRVHTEKPGLSQRRALCEVTQPRSSKHQSHTKTKQG